MPIINMAGALGTGGDASGVIAQQNMAVAGQLMDLMRLKEQRRSSEARLGLAQEQFDFNVERAATDDQYRAEVFARETERQQVVDARMDRQLDLREAEFESRSKAQALQQTLQSDALANQVQSGLRGAFPRTAGGILQMLDAMEDLDPTGEQTAQVEAIIDRYTGGRFSNQSLPLEERVQALQGSDVQPLIYAQVGTALRTMQRFDRAQDRAAAMMRQVEGLNARVEAVGDKRLVDEWMAAGLEEFAVPETSDPDQVLDYFEGDASMSLQKWEQRIGLAEEKKHLRGQFDARIANAAEALEIMGPDERAALGALRGDLEAAETVAEAREAYAAFLPLVDPSAKLAADFRMLQAMGLPGGSGVQMSPQFFSGAEREAQQATELLATDAEFRAELTSVLGDLGYTTPQQVRDALQDPQQNVRGVLFEAYRKYLSQQETAAKQAAAERELSVYPGPFGQ